MARAQQSQSQLAAAIRNATAHEGPLGFTAVRRSHPDSTIWRASPRGRRARRWDRRTRAVAIRSVDRWRARRKRTARASPAVTPTSTTRSTSTPPLSAMATPRAAMAAREIAERIDMATSVQADKVKSAPRRRNCR